MSTRYNSHRKLKEVLEGCLPAITHITNSLLDSGSFCEEWKEAIVKTIYRPVSNLGFSSKVVEKVTLEKFMKHCNPE